MVCRLESAPSIRGLGRRRLLQAVAAAPALLLPGGLPRASDALDLIGLHPTRFFAGLILNIARAVLVDLASDYIAALLRSGQVTVGHLTFAASPPRVEAPSTGGFDHVGYKVSVVRLGVVDYQAHQRRLLALQLKEPGQTARFTALRDYLRDEHIRVKLADANQSHFLGADLTPDDLFTLEFLDIPAERLPNHYRNLIDASGTRIFDTWYG
jgi:hypothetical protein